MEWCIQSGLVCELSEAAVVVLALDPGPWVARGRQGKLELEDWVTLAAATALHLQRLMSSRCVSCGDGRVAVVAGPRSEHLT